MSILKELVNALIETAYDRQEEAKVAICSALLDIGRTKPDTTIIQTIGYLQDHPKLNKIHRILLLNTMNKVIELHLDNLSKELYLSIIQLGINEMSMTLEIVPDWQTAASTILVTSGLRYPEEVALKLLDKMPTAGIPHFFTIQALGQLASANSKIVPLVKREAVLGRMLPMMGAVKQDNMKWAFASCVGRVCEAVLNYTGDKGEAAKHGISRSDFSGEVYSAYDILFNVWINSKESKLRLAIMDALGHMAALLATETLIEQSARLFNGILGLYRKNQEHYYITQCLGYVISAAQDKDIPLDIHLEVLLNTLYLHACQPIDAVNPMSLKNRNEAWRTCEIISRKNSDRMIGFLLSKLEPTGEKTRLGAMDILSHLINSADEVLEDKKPMILNGLKIICQDPNLRVRRALVMVIKAMAHKDYLGLEGGHTMVQFLVQQASLPPDPKEKKDSTAKSDTDTPTNSELRKISENMLYLMTTTLPQMTTVFWPFLLEFLVPVQFTESIGAVCQTLVYMASSKRENKEEDFDLDYETMVNIPKPHSMFVRLLVLAGVPIKPIDGPNELRGVHVLKLMKALSPNIHEDLVSLWDAVIPKLITQLTEFYSQGTFSQKTWEDLIMKLLSKTLDELDDEDWLLLLGKELSEQCISLYAEYSDEKAILYKCQGVVLRKTTNKVFLQEQLTAMFNTVRHIKQVEREGLACGYGISAASHLDTILEKLEQISSQDMVRKSTGLFGLTKDKSEADVERIKSTVMLCYGFSSLYAPPALIPSRIEVTIIRNINPHFNNIKDPAVKHSLIKTIELIGRALHPSHLGENTCDFTHRMDLIKHLQTYIKQESKSIILTDTRSLCIQALTTLVKLDPPLQAQEQTDITNTVFEYVIALPDTQMMIPSKKDVFTGSIDQLFNDVMTDINSFLKELLKKKPNTDNLIEMFRSFLPYLSQPHPLKMRAASLWKCVLLEYLDNLTQSREGRQGGQSSPSTDQSPFSCLPELLGYLVPKATDPLLCVRSDCLRSIQLLLLINNRYMGINPDLKDQYIEALSILMGRADNEDGLFNLASDLGKVLARKLPDSMVLSFIGVTIEGLMDAEASSASGAVVVLNQTLKVKGQSLLAPLSQILDSLLDQLSKLPPGQNRTGTLRCIRTYTTYHLQPIVAHLLDRSNQLTQEMIDSWQCLAREPSLAKPLLDVLMDTLDRSLPYQEKNEGGVVRVLSTPKPRAVVCVFAQLFPLDEMEGLILEHYPRLFSQMITRIGVCAMIEGQSSEKVKGKDTDSPIQETLNTFRILLTAASQDTIISLMDSQSYWSLLEGGFTYPEGITELARAFSLHASGFIPKTVHVLNSALSSIYDPFRIVSTAFFAELINQQAMGIVQQGEEEVIKKDLVEQLINSLLGRLVDSHYTVRMLCIRGLGNIASHNQQLVQTFSTTVLSAMMSGMDDKEDPDDYITMEAMSGLSKIIAKIDEGHVRPILVNIILRIRPCFEKSLPGVRTAAFTLFGDLSQFGDGPSKDPYLEQIFSNLVTILVHMNENEQSVVSACKQTLCKVGPLIGNEDVNQMFQKHLSSNKQIIYGEFLDGLTKKLAIAFPNKLNFFTLSATLFFKSVWPDVRANAALFVGFMLYHIPRDLQEGISSEQVSEALIGLLHDSIPEVRVGCAYAISLLANY
ncbi:Maestro heat-like repeat-containing protein family member 1 isoform X2 [Oopsacas minuta]|uniref:Maestro heat-like repeat-containing protein family member 1 isoform X2 n=1 Tax=Oopsacas minuta TaxID=111878 RepID=A0AAV7JDY3_9METZ|nr:Maestro heat-like repeat-containing protein family member 1 isoform X2 [Oopsacas minuta]